MPSAAPRVGRKSVWLTMLLALSVGWCPAALAAQVQHLATQTATATGAGATGKPAIASFAIPSGKNRVLFVWGSFERDHCSNADATGGLCTTANTAGTGLGDNWPEPRTGVPPATTTNSQITAQIVGPGGTVNKQNALVIGGSPSGDTRFITISNSPNGSPAGTAFFSVSSFHIALFENEINLLLGGAASGTVSISFPDVTLPTNAGDDAMLIASVYQNVEQTVTGFVRNATGVQQQTGGVEAVGNYTITPAAYDAGQVPDEADDGKLVMGTNATTQGFTTPAGHAVLATPATTNASGNWDNPGTNTNNEPNGFSAGAYFRNGGATPGSSYTLTSAAPASPSVYGGTSASFLLESDNADVGDAPVTYGNPSHTISGIRLGASVDADASLLNNASASGDDANNTDDEDGVTLTPLLPSGQTTVVPVSIQNGSGFLSAWFDWNADGDFNDAGEQMVNAQAVVAGTTNLNIAVPNTAVVGPTFARFRVCSNNLGADACSTPVGTVQSGEVEDYQFTVSRSLALFKTTTGIAGGPFGFTLTNTAQTTGTATTAAAGTPVQVDGDTATAGVQAYSIVSPTTAVTINESSLPAGWSVTNATCTNAAGTTVGSRSGNVYTLTGAEVAASTNFSCTFTNAAAARVTVTKVSNGGVGTFAFSGDNGFAAQNITTVAAGTGVSGATQTLTTPSTATRITEAAPPAGFVLSAISCTGLGAGGTATPTINGSGGGFVDLSAQATAPGSNIACTFTNNALGSITIVKDAQPDSAQDFTFVSAESPLLNFNLDDDADATLPNSRTIPGLASGIYTVTESLAPGWTLTSIACVDADGGTTTNLLLRSAVIDLDPGENITCTFVNGATGIADLQIAKTNNSAGPLVAGTTTTYVLTVTNNGPAAVTGAVVRDAPGTGLDCPAANPVTCSPAAACPAGTTTGNLTSNAGVTLGNIANGGVVTLSFTCNVQ
jgi:uncharacterized repeat protein (TIGR01451 family)